MMMDFSKYLKYRMLYYTRIFLQPPLRHFILIQYPTPSFMSSEAHKPCHSKRQAKTHLQRNIILHRTPQIDTAHISLQSIVRDDIDTQMRRRILHTDYEQPEN